MSKMKKTTIGLIGIIVAAIVITVIGYRYQASNQKPKFNDIGTPPADTNPNG